MPWALKKWRRLPSESHSEVEVPMEGQSERRNIFGSKDEGRGLSQ